MASHLIQGIVGAAGPTTERLANTTEGFYDESVWKGLYKGYKLTHPIEIDKAFGAEVPDDLNVGKLCYTISAYSPGSLAATAKKGLARMSGRFTAAVAPHVVRAATDGSRQTPSSSSIIGRLRSAVGRDILTEDQKGHLRAAAKTAYANYEEVGITLRDSRTKYKEYKEELASARGKHEALNETRDKTLRERDITLRLIEKDKEEYSVYKKTYGTMKERYETERRAAVVAMAKAPGKVRAALTTLARGITRKKSRSRSTSQGGVNSVLLAQTSKLETMSEALALMKKGIEAREVTVKGLDTEMKKLEKGIEGYEKEIRTGEAKVERAKEEVDSYGERFRIVQEEAKKTSEEVHKKLGGELIGWKSVKHGGGGGHGRTRRLRRR